MVGRPIITHHYRVAAPGGGSTTLDLAMSGDPGIVRITHFEWMDAATYAALAVKAPTTLYFITPTGRGVGSPHRWPAAADSATELYLGSSMVSAAWLDGVQVPAFSPLDLSPVLWLDAADTATITEVGGAVSQWDDKSGNGNHVTQGTAAAQPTTGTRTQNSLNVLDFDGSDSLALVGAFLSQPNTVIAVAEFDSVAGTHNVVDGVSNIARNLLRVGTSTFLMYAGSTLTGGSPATSTPYALVATFNGVSSSLRVNGSTTFTGGVGAQQLRLVRLGSEFDGTGQELDGAIAEVIVVDGTLTAGEIAATESYLAAKWGITL